MLLHRPAKGVKPPVPGTEGVHLGIVAPPDDIYTSTTSITFRAHHPERASKGRQTFFPYDDGTLSVVELSQLSQELILQSSDHHR
jgi:hypothetical protein